MIEFRRGNLFDADVEALVNTVNTVGVMGKGIALMFKERFPSNYKAYRDACEKGEVEVGSLFVTRTDALTNPRFIINFPTKKHWRSPSQIGWVEQGLSALREFIEQNQVASIAIPPLGAGNGGLEWSAVRRRIEATLADVAAEIIVYEPTDRYQNVRKTSGVQKLTSARAAIAELVRRYANVNMQCSFLEVHKLAYFLEAALPRKVASETLDLRFEAGRYGPYAQRLQHLLNSLDGSYLISERRVADARPFDTLVFHDAKYEKVATFLRATDQSEIAHSIDRTESWIEGFQSPFGLELLATCHWLTQHGNVELTVPALREGIKRWPESDAAARRKSDIFADRYIELAVDRIGSFETAH